MQPFYPMWPPRPFFLCTRCLRALRTAPSRRLLTTTTAAPSPQPAAHALLTTRRLIALSGHDASHLLQGLTTANIRASLLPSQGFYGAFLNAAGRVLHDVFIYPAGSLGPDAKGGDSKEAGFLIEVDAREVERLAAHLRRFKLRAKVTVRVLEEGEYGVWGLWGHEPLARERPRNQIGCEDTRAPGMGWRLVLPGGTKPEEGEDDKDGARWGQERSVGSYEVRRMLSGVAEGQGEILRETALPLESNMDYMGGIDFRKGCYVGQELTIRTRHTGVVRKRILPVQLYPADSDQPPPETLTYTPTIGSTAPSQIAAGPSSSSSAAASPLPLPPPGTNIWRVDPKGRSAGKWLGGVGNIGLALCRLETMTDTVLTDGGNSWLPQHEFKASWEEEGEGGRAREVKVKAFVPSWHRNTRRNLGVDLLAENTRGTS